MGSDPDPDHRGRARRALLAYYLTGYFQQTLDLKLELEVQKLALEQRKTDLNGIGQMRG